MAETFAQIFVTGSCTRHWAQDTGQRGFEVGIWSKLIGQLQSSSEIQYTEVSAPTAKERLKVALTYDRNGLEPGAIDSLREDIVRLMAEHLDIKADDVQVDIDDTTGPNRLVASIALRPQRRAQGAKSLAATES